MSKSEDLDGTMSSRRERRAAAHEPDGADAPELDALLAEGEAEAAAEQASEHLGGWQRFRAWAKRRPFVGGLLVAVAGVEMFFSGQLDIGHLHVQLGIEGLQATIIPIALLLLGVLAIAMPVHHVFYGVIALAVALYSLIGVNLGGFLIGMIMASVGGVLVVAWMPPEARGAGRPRGLLVTARRTRLAAAVLAVGALVTPLTVGAATAPAATVRHTGFCDVLPWLCPAPKPADPAPTPSRSDPASATPAPDPGTDEAADDGAKGTAPVAKGTAPTPTPSPVVAQPDAGAPVFTDIPAQMGSKGLSFSGLKSIGIVTVPTKSGKDVRVLKISADAITITGFSLTVRPPDGPGLVTKADTMALRGNVTVYIGSITAEGHDGKTLTLGLDTPPALDDIRPGLLRVTMGLVGTLADSISYTNTNQYMVE
ncbi:DUF6114 domain-containing protein [Microbacterium sp. KUDC0406]|uniref:DUF6114 domain-containing protein n=1 Tax=Microbacterium sp. KUDC0406 TaxID=2909588 RepID=UPI001F2493DF|nr:DUF6114 domain-containing protein [Microbacterium sp. KUDC0406]UJP10762.1 DUF6114 domain-containing protein [Microbacterium sp. KUDC0406]